MLKRSLLFIFLVLVMLSAGTASAYVTTSDTEISVWGDVGKDLKWLETQVNNASLITEAEPGIFYVNRSIRLYTSGTTASMYINDSTCTELRIQNSNYNGLYSGKWYIDNTTIVSWNHEQNRPAYNNEHQVGCTVYAGWIQNTNISNMRYVTLDRIVKDCYNITSHNNYEGVKFTTTDGYDFYNITVKNTTYLRGLYFTGVKNSTIYNLHAENIGSYTSPTTNQEGIAFESACDNITLSDVYINDTAWSSLLISGNSTNFDVNNVTINYSGHNGLDIHWARYIDISDIDISNSVSNNAIITYSGADYQTNNINIYDVSSTNAGTDIGIKITTAKNILVHNYTSVNDGSGFSSLDSDNVTLINGSISSATNGITLTYLTTTDKNAKNTTIINTEITGCTNDIVQQDADNTRIVNTNVTIDLINGDYSVLYPINIKVENTTGLVVANAEVTVTTSGLSLNGYGVETLTAYTDTDGKLNESQQLYVADFLRDSSAGYTYYTVDVQASKDGKTDSELDINPDSSWYSSDLDNLNGTLITLTLDVPGEGEYEYWTPTPGKHYIGVPETSTWSAGSWITTFSGTYTEEQTEVTGVEVRP